MYVLCHFDWYGNEEGLKNLDKLWEEGAKKTKGAEFKGRFGPLNQKYHWTMIVEVKDLRTWDDYQDKFSSYKRDYKNLSSVVYDFYSGKLN